MSVAPRARRLEADIDRIRHRQGLHETASPAREPSTGQVILDGEGLLRVGKEKPIDIRRHKMGMAFRNFGLLPHLSVVENVA